MKAPAASGHTILIAEPEDLAPGEAIWVRCLPHGDVGAWATRPEAFVGALEHDRKHGGQSG